VISLDLGLENKVVVVTGAGGGIGREIAIAFSKMGSKVVICDINRERAEETCTEMRGDHLLSIKDLSRVSDCRELVEETVKKYGQLNILINNAAIIHRIPIEDVSEEDWDRMMDVNLKSQFFLTREACKVMEREGWGRVINISSQGGFTGGYATSTVYAITKGGILTLTKSMARNYANKGITINAVAPGGVDTEMMKLSKKDLESFTSLIPMGRLADSTELVGAVLFLASHWATYITGATIDVNGGQLMR
jgi:NAD(P)-dependent dehydrogenase (short-subunit alcohol dehydrogenase family)